MGWRVVLCVMVSCGCPLLGPDARLAADDGVADGDDTGLLQQGYDLAQQHIHPYHHHGKVVGLR